MERRRVTRFLAAAVALMAVGLLAACGGGTDSESATTGSAPTEPSTTQTSEATAGTAAGGESTAEEREVAVSYMNILALAPLFAGEEAGIFAKHGIKNEYTNVNLYDALPAISQGDIDVGIMAASAAFYNAINGGQNLVAFVDRLTYACRSDNKLVVRKELFDQGVESFADLKGMTIAILGEGSATEYWNDLLLEKNNMTVDDFTSIKYLTYPDTVTALKTGAVDAGYLAEPLLTQAVSDGTAVPIEAMYNVVPGDDVGFMIFSGDFANSDRDTATAWTAAWLESVRYFLDPANKDAVIAAVSKWTEIPVEQLEEIYGTDSWPWMNPNGEIALDGPEKALDWMLDKGYIEEIPPVDAWYDPSFTQDAVGTLGEADVSDPCAENGS